MWNTIWQEYADDFNGYEDRDQLEDAHLCWCRAATDYLCRMQSHMPPMDTKVALRGTPMGMKQRTLTTKFHQGMTTAVNAHAKSISKALNRCRELGRRIKAFVTSSSSNNGTGDTDGVFWEQADEDTVKLLSDICDTANGTDIQADLSSAPTQAEVESAAQILEQSQKQQAADSRNSLAKRVREGMKSATKRYFNYLTRDYASHRTTVMDPATGNYTAKLDEIHEIFERAWEPVFNIHKHSPPCWQTFKDKYQPYIERKPGAPKGPPTDGAMFRQAQRAASGTASGMDGWKPVELKQLPLEAWTQRRRVTCISFKLGKRPSAYYRVASPALE